MTGDEMVEWHHQLNEHEFEQAPGDGKPGMLQFMGVTKSQMLLNNNKPHFVCAFKDEGPTEWLEYLLGSRGSHVKNTPNMVSETVG